MTDKENKKFNECCGDDRFEIIKRAREHIIDATNIESRPEEMQVLDNFLFRCWQMGWLKNDFHQLEKENEELKKELMHLKGCKNCTDRPEGELATVCATEYEDNCIAQKMTHIKELQEENAELEKLAENRKAFIDWCVEHHKEILKEYTGF